jgi:hypothetical protein
MREETVMLFVKIDAGKSHGLMECIKVESAYQKLGSSTLHHIMVELFHLFTLILPWYNEPVFQGGVS